MGEGSLQNTVLASTQKILVNGENSDVFVTLFYFTYKCVLIYKI
jgi:hypothetical protein